MRNDYKHKLTYDFSDDIVKAHCACGDWSWNAVRNGNLLPLQIFTAIDAEHRRHIALGQSPRALN
ncbi:MAG: hypothetical protein U0840_26395 [Gemmataceae bacterium]